MHVLSGMLEAPDWAPHGSRRKVMTGGSDEPIIIGLAIAVIIGIGIVCLMDALKNKLK